MNIGTKLLTKSLFETTERTDTNKTKLEEEVTRTGETLGKNSIRGERPDIGVFILFKDIFH